MDQNINEKKISALVSSENKLEILIGELLGKSVARTDISIQGTPEQIEDKFGHCFIDPTLIQSSANPPMKEPFLNDDYGWVLGFSFSLPFFICLITGIFIIGDITSTRDNLVYGFIGALIGSILGLFLYSLTRKRHDRKIRKQEKKGGFLIWINTHSSQQYQQVMEILFKNRAHNINTSI
ncbi:MAG: hypothetical protein H0T84_11595 [Tatlockia sp.]|nr:hypothetical protein [Tatlockia sp.]